MISKPQLRPEGGLDMVKVNKTIRTVFFAALVVLMLFAASCNSNAPNLKLLELDGNDASVESTPRRIYYNLTDKSWYENSAATKKISSIPTLPTRQISIIYSQNGTPPVADDGKYPLPEALHSADKECLHRKHS